MFQQLMTLLLLAVVAAPAVTDEGVAKGGNALVQTTILYPPSGATVFLDPNVGTVTIPLLADTDVPNDTAVVEFFSSRQREALLAQRIANDTLVPYLVEFQLSSNLGFNQTFTLTARATSISDSAVQPIATSLLGFATTTGDFDFNGLPDAPSQLLVSPGDLWYSTAQFDDEISPEMLSVVANLFPLLGSEFNESTVVLPSLSNPEQVVRATALRDLIGQNEQGLFVVQTAQSLARLVGQDGADNIAPEREGALAGAGQYVNVGVAIREATTDFEAIPESRLADNPVSVFIDGLALSVANAYAVYRYPTSLTTDSESGFVLSVPSGQQWLEVGGAVIEAEAGRVSVDMEQPGILAVVCVTPDVAEGEGEGEGEIEGGDLLLRILTALGILQFTDGGVGGSGPCFIATAAYGTPLAAEIDVFRRFRDVVLLENAFGTVFVDAYYRVSPPMADMIAREPVLVWLSRIALTITLAIVAIGINFTSWICFFWGLMLMCRRLFRTTLIENSLSYVAGRTTKSKRISDN